MSQGKKKQAWAVMTKLVPTVNYRDIENNYQDVEIPNVSFTVSVIDKI